MNIEQKRVIAGSEVTLFILTKNGYQAVAGQEFTEVLREVELVSVMTKETAGKASYIPVSTSYTVNCNGYYVVNDCAFETLEVAYDELTNVDVEIQAGGVYRYRGVMSVEELPLTFDNKEAEMKIKLVGSLTREKLEA